MTLDEELSEVCFAFRQEMEKGTFLFTPFEQSVKFLHHLKKGLVAKEIVKDDVYAMIRKLRQDVIAFENAIQEKGLGNVDQQTLPAKKHKQMVFSLMHHLVQEILDLLAKGDTPSPPSPGPTKPARKANLRKQGWMRT